MSEPSEWQWVKALDLQLCLPLFLTSCKAPCTSLTFCEASQRGAAGYKIVSTAGRGPLGEDYLRGFAESVFCLAATGAGWGFV